MKVNNWIIGLVGIWFVISAFIGANSQFIMWSNLISGVIIAISGFTTINKQPVAGWIAGILGIWMIISAFLPSLHTGTGLLWNGIIAGLIVAIDGLAALDNTNTPSKTAHKV